MYYMSKVKVYSGCEIVPCTDANVTTFFTLATKSSKEVAKLVKMLRHNHT